MKIGYFGREEDSVSDWLSRMSELEKIPLLKIDEKKNIDQSLDYLIIGGAPLDNENYWEGLVSLAKKLPKTNFLILELDYCSKEEIIKKMGKKAKLEILDLDFFSEKVNELIDLAK